MVLIAASIFSKSGKALVSRQFVEMTRARVEGLLDAFPKLVGTGKDVNRQHTFVETDSVRYVFHPLDNVYMVLITTKASNILEDLETLRLFTRVIPEYCRSNDEKEILNKAFELIFAFDEIVSLGYRESVNLAQIRTFTDMDSHEERVFLQIKSAQEKAAKETMDARAKELKRQQKEALSKGLKPNMNSFSSSTGISSSSTPLTAVSTPAATQSSVAPSRVAGGGKALKLGAKAGKDDDSFIRQLRQEGQAVAPLERGSGGAAVRAAQESTQMLKREPVHVRIEERLSAEVPRDGGLKTAEILGSVSVSVATEEFNTAAFQMHNNADAAEGIAVQIQVHPNIDKSEWNSSSLLRLKSAGKPFPVKSDVGVLKWRATVQDEEALPIVLNVWPQEAPDGCQVNIEYTLQKTDMALNDVIITVPLPTATTPVVAECEGTYEYQKARNQLVWTVPVIDSSNPSGTLEFVTPNGAADHFFPVKLGFSSDKLLVDIGLDDVVKMDGSDSIAYSSSTIFNVEKYEIV